MSDYQVNPRSKSEPSGALFGRFLVSIVLFVGGLVLIGSGGSGGNETLDPSFFVGGILAIGLAFGLPMIGAHERG